MRASKKRSVYTQHNMITINEIFLSFTSNPNNHLLSHLSPPKSAFGRKIYMLYASHSNSKSVSLLFSFYFHFSLSRFDFGFSVCAHLTLNIPTPIRKMLLVCSHKKSTWYQFSLKLHRQMREREEKHIERKIWEQTEGRGKMPLIWKLKAFSNTWKYFRMTVREKIFCGAS